MYSDKKYDYTPLTEPLELRYHNWSPETLPIVSTTTITYNHKDFIKECLESILMQKTTFPVQILIHDDASTDGTTEIVREYEAKYPNLITAFYQKENTYFLKNKREKRADYRNAQIGKYIAKCEGDDYWTDPLNLQKHLIIYIKLIT